MRKLGLLPLPGKTLHRAKFSRMMQMRSRAASGVSRFYIGPAGRPLNKAPLYVPREALSLRGLP
jgi:hypothetical protein